MPSAYPQSGSLLRFLDTFNHPHIIYKSLTGAARPPEEGERPPLHFSMPTLLEVPPTDPRVVALMRAQQRELRALYQDTDERTEPFNPATLGEGSLVLAVEEAGGALLACGAVKRLSDQEAEVKRMYTAPEARGRGLGRQILNGLMERSRLLGYTRLLLETGDAQPEAAHLYESAGFTRIPNYGYYAGTDGSLCYALTL